MKKLFTAILLLLWATESAHAGFLVPFVLAALEITLSATAVAAITFVVNVAAAYGISYVAGKLINKPEPGEPQGVGGIEIDLRADAKIPQSFIFGRAVTAGSLVYAGTFGRAPGSGTYATIFNNELIEIIDICDHPVTGLVKVFIEGQEITLAAPSGDRGQVVTSGNYGDHLALKFYDGTQTTADQFTVDRLGTAPNQPWTSAMVGTGVTYARLHYVYQASKVPGRLRWKFVIDGAKLYDPRKDTTVGGSGTHRYDTLSTHEWTANLAVIVYNVLRGFYVANSVGTRQFFYGLENTTADQFPLDIWFAAMNECDVSMDIGGSATEAQYKIGGEVAIDVEPMEFVQAAVKSCGGRLVEVGGIYKLYIGAPGLSVQTIADESLRADVAESFRPILGLQDRINYITGSYTSPEDGWVEKVAPDRRNATWETEDGRRLPADLTVPLVQSGRQVQQLMEQLLLRSRQQRKHTIPLGRGGFQIEPGDIITWNSTRNGYVAKLFEVDDVDYDPNLNATLSVTEVDPADYDWVSAQQVTEIPGDLISAPPDPKTVVGFAATGVEWLSEQGYKRPAIKLQWTVPSEDLDINAVLWELRVKANPANITSGQILDVQAGSGLISAGVISNTEYEVRAKYQSSANYESNWSLWISVTTPDTKLTQAETDIILDTSALAGLPALAQLVDEHSALLLQQNDALLGVQDLAESASASALFRIIAVSTPADALAAIEMQVRSIIGSSFASAGIQLISYTNNDGFEASRIRMYADSVQIGQPGLTGGDFVNLFEVSNVHGQPAIVMRAELFKDDGIDTKMMRVGSATGVITLTDADQNRTYNAWNNAGAGEEFSTLTCALAGDGVVVIQCFLLVVGNNVLQNSTGHFVSITANTTEILNRSIEATVLSAANGHISLCVAADNLPAGTNTLIGKLRLNDTGTAGGDNATVSNIRWIVTEHHKAAIQAGGAAAAAVTYHSTQTAENANDVTFSAVAIGTAAANRRVVLGVGFRSSANTVAAITIGGVVAERLVNRRPSETPIVVQMWEATVPTGTTADIVVATSGAGVNDLAVSVWDVTSAAEAAADITSDGSPTGSSPLTMSNHEIQAGGVVLAFAYARGRNTFALTWTGVDTPTENAEADVGSSGCHYAAYSFLTTESTVDDDFSFTHSAVSTPAYAAVAAISLR